MPNLTENTKVLILFKLEEGWSIWRVAQACNIAQSIVQRIKQTILWCSEISATFYVVLPNLYKKDDAQISKRHLYVGKKL
jgi:hypothetical protein